MAVAGCALLLLGHGGRANAQADDACPLVVRPAFAGHAFELDATLDPTSYSIVNGYPDLDHAIQKPTVATHAGDGSNRIFVADQYGEIGYFDDDPEATDFHPFFDVSLTRMMVRGGESGLLGLAFDPDFGNESSARFGEFYLYISVANSECLCEVDDSCELLAGSERTQCTQVVRFRATAEDGPLPDTVDPDAEGEIILEIEQPFDNHNGGSIVFGPDDLLYIASGDGGRSTGQNTAQHDDSLLGKILRIDPRGQTTYAIPPGNPFAGDGSKAQEILHLGLRNPWKITFDRETGDLWIGDVGAGRWEEIDHAPFGAAAPINFGWPECEGTHEIPEDNDDPPIECDFEHERPVVEIPRPSTGGAITGGYVYRGSDLPSLYGHYVFGELTSRTVYAWDRSTVDPATGLGVVETLDVYDRQFVTFGETAEGELLVPQYKFSGSSEFGRFQSSGGPGSEIPSRLSQTGLFVNTAADPLVAAMGMIEYDIESPLWSDGASKRRWFALPGRTEIRFRATRAWAFPVGTVLVKHFELPHADDGTRRVETRVMLHQANDWLGFTYRWNNAQTDANLLTVELVEDICLDDSCSEQQTWTYPGPSTCLSCHTTAADRVLGLRTEQLNRIVGEENQLRTLNCLGVFDNDIGTPDAYQSFTAIDDETAGVHERARSYLASNCAHCHHPENVVQADIDLRFATPLSETGLVGEAPIHEIPGLVDPSLLEPGDAAQSVLWHRQHTDQFAIRMARLTRIRDDAAVDLQEDWIEDAVVNDADDDHDGEDDASDNCPQVYNPGQEDFDSDDEGDACDPDTRPDLTAQAPDYDGGTLAPGERIGLGGFAENEGTGPAGPTQLRFFVSDDTNFDADEDTWIGSCFVDPLGPAELGHCTDNRARIPDDYVSLEPGESVERYLGACSDALDLVDEDDEGNNCAVGSALVLVPEPAHRALQAAAIVSLMALRRHFARRSSRVAKLD